MSLFWRQQRDWVGASDGDLIASDRHFRGGSKFRRKSMSREEALLHSAIWACLRLRADLVSTMPVDVFRQLAGGPKVEVNPKPPILVTPGGERVRWMEWSYSSQFDMDSTGNTIGLITATDATGRPARVDLFPTEETAVKKRKDGTLKYRLAGEWFDPPQVWHEKQFTISGCPVGLSPIAYAAMSTYTYLSAQQFAADWFDNSNVPSAHMKNNAKTLTPKEIREIKKRHRESIQAGDLFVTGKDWTYEILAGKVSEAHFLEQQQFGLADACRWFGVPGDMIEASQSGSSVTYANITQRNLQFLILHLGPAIRRREEAWTWGFTPGPQYVKLNRGALLEMDLKSRYEGHKIGITGRFIAPSEARALEEREPFTDEQLAEFDRLFGRPNSGPQQQESGVPA